MSVLAAQGDPRRSMALLWRSRAVAEARGAPGPKPTLSTDAIVEAAIAVADSEGMAALSMRAVAERLGVTAMALYTYVPSKHELIDLMYDGAHAELPVDYDASHGWRAAVTAWMEDLIAFYLRHPWVLEVSFARPVLGPNEQAVLETVGRILHETDLSPGVARPIVSMLFSVARGTAQTITESRVAAASDVSEQDWWSRRSAALREVVPDFAERFPMTAWLASEHITRHDHDTTPYLERQANEALMVGLNVLLDGIEATMTSAATPGSKTTSLRD